MRRPLPGETLQAKLLELRDGGWGAMGDDWLSRVRASLAVATVNHDVVSALQACAPVCPHSLSSPSSEAPTLRWLGRMCLVACALVARCAHIIAQRARKMRASLLLLRSAQPLAPPCALSSDITPDTPTMA